MTKPLVIYHANCQDGHTAAWVMRRWLQQCAGEDPEMFAAPRADQLVQQNHVNTGAELRRLAVDIREGKL